MIKIIYIFVFLFTFITHSGYVNADDSSQKISIEDLSWMHGLTLGDNLKYAEDFQYFDYINPDAPKRGTLVQAAIGSFDTLNPFNMKGVPAIGSSYYI